MWKKFNSFIHLFPHLPFAVAMFWGPLLRVCLGLLNSNIHPWSQIQKHWKFFLFLVKLLARWSDCISALALSHLGVEPADLPAIVVDREIFRVLQGLLPLRPSPKENRRHENKAMQVLDFSIFCNLRFCFNLNYLSLLSNLPSVCCFVLFIGRTVWAANRDIHAKN